MVSNCFEDFDRMATQPISAFQKMLTVKVDSVRWFGMLAWFQIAQIAPGTSFACTSHGSSCWEGALRFCATSQTLNLDEFGRLHWLWDDTLTLTIVSHSLVGSCRAGWHLTAELDGKMFNVNCWTSLAMFNQKPPFLGDRNHGSARWSRCSLKALKAIPFKPIISPHSGSPPRCWIPWTHHCTEFHGRSYGSWGSRRWQTPWPCNVPWSAWVAVWFIDQIFWWVTGWAVTWCKLM